MTGIWGGGGVSFGGEWMRWVGECIGWWRGRCTRWVRWVYGWVEVCIWGGCMGWVYGCTVGQNPFGGILIIPPNGIYATKWVYFM